MCLCMCIYVRVHVRVRVRVRVHVCMCMCITRRVPQTESSKCVPLIRRLPRACEKLKVRSASPQNRAALRAAGLGPRSVGVKTAQKTQTCVDINNKIKIETLRQFSRTAHSAANRALKAVGLLTLLSCEENPSRVIPS